MSHDFWSAALVNDLPSALMLPLSDFRGALASPVAAVFLVLAGLLEVAAASCANELIPTNTHIANTTANSFFIDSVSSREFEKEHCKPFRVCTGRADTWIGSRWRLGTRPVESPDSGSSSGESSGWML